MINQKTAETLRTQRYLIFRIHIPIQQRRKFKSWRHKRKRYEELIFRFTIFNQLWGLNSPASTSSTFCAWVKSLLQNAILNSIARRIWLGHFSIPCQLSTVNRQPSTVNRQPSTVNRQPSTVNTKNVLTNGGYCYKFSILKKS